jgi:hypothetical protein
MGLLKGYTDLCANAQATDSWTSSPAAMMYWMAKNKGANPGEVSEEPLREVFEGEGGYAPECGLMDIGRGGLPEQRNGERNLGENASYGWSGPRKLNFRWFNSLK